MKVNALLWATLFLPSLVMAQEPEAEAEATPIEGSVDVYFMPGANIESRQRSPVSSADESGDGYGLKGLLHLSDMFMLTGEYQTVSYETPGADRDDFRAGAGIGLPSGSGLFAEYVSLDSGTGFGVHARGAGTMGERLALHVQAGYVQVEDDERFGGFELSAGGSYAIINILKGTLGAFADYRVTHLEGAVSQVELKLRDFRVGVRYTFGGDAALPAPVEDESVGVEPVVDDGGATEAPADAPEDEVTVEEPAPAGEEPVVEEPPAE